MNASCNFFEDKKFVSTGTGIYKFQTFIDTYTGKDG